MFVNGVETLGNSKASDLTGTGIGAGKRNTELLVKAMGDKTYYTMGAKKVAYAAKLCYDLVFNGFDDWFLPSKDELNLLYVTFLALLEGRLKAEVVRAAFCIKLLDIEGEFAGDEASPVIRYILSQPIGATYSFEPTEQGRKELIRTADKARDRILDYPLRSLEVLRSLERQLI